MNRSPTVAAARFSSLVPPPIHPMQARLLALVAAHRFATTTQLARLTALEYASSASALRQTQRHLANLAQQRLLTSLERRVGGWQGGSAVTIWAATTRGHRLVAADEGEEVPRRQRPPPRDYRGAYQHRGGCPPANGYRGGGGPRAGLLAHCTQPQRPGAGAAPRPGRDHHQPGL